MRSAKSKRPRARNKSARRDKHQKKAQPTKAMALISARDAVRRLPANPLPATSNELSDDPTRSKRPATRGGNKSATQVENPVASGRDGTDPPCAVPVSSTVAEGARRLSPLKEASCDFSDSAFASQMQLFATMLSWSPLGILLRQQALLTQMMFNMRYPKKSEPS